MVVPFFSDNNTLSEMAIKEMRLVESIEWQAVVLMRQIASNPRQQNGNPILRPFHEKKAFHRHSFLLFSGSSTAAAVTNSSFVVDRVDSSPIPTHLALLSLQVDDEQ